MKKLILSLVVLAVLLVVIGGGLFFDYYRQNQKISSIESRLDLISTLVENRKNPKGIDDMMRTTEMDLVQLSNRWITGRKLSAESKISYLKDQLKAETNPTNSPNTLPTSNEDLKKEVERLSNRVNKDYGNK